MGGIPWQSKGCINCRRRKIKCDQGRPECVRCLKRGLKCEGSDNHSQFIGAPSLNQSKKKDERIIIRNRHAEARPRDALLSAGISSKQAMRVQMFASFQHQTFPASKSPSINGYQSFLLSSIGNLPQKSPIVDKAVSALACLFLGKTTHDPPVFHHGLQLYNSSMRHMSNLIRRGIFDNDLLYTAYVFQEIEILYCPNGLTAWGTHIAGMDALLKRYRRNTQNDPIAEALYSHQHKMIVFTTSTGMNLSEPEYEYLMEPSNGDPLLEIIQSGVAIGRLQTLLDTVDQSDPVACQDILHRSYEAQECLFNLRAGGRLGEDPSEDECAANSFQPRDDTIPSSNRLFGYPYNFSSSDHVTLYIMFWGVLILFQQLIHRAHSIVQLHANGTRLGIQEEFQSHEILFAGIYANKIARAVPYCLQDSLKNTCHAVVSFILSGASGHYVEIGDRAKFDWCQKVFQHILTRGTDSSAHLLALGNSRWEGRDRIGRDEFVCLSIRSQTDNAMCNVIPPALPTESDGVAGSLSASSADGPTVVEIYD